MKNVFLHGAVFNRTVDQLNEFALAESELTKKGYTVTTAMDAYPNFDEQNRPETIELYLSTRAKQMEASDVVVYLETFNEDHYAVLDIKNARAAGLRCISFPAFIELYSSKPESINA